LVRGLRFLRVKRDRETGTIKELMGGGQTGGGSEVTNKKKRAGMGYGE